MRLSDYDPAEPGGASVSADLMPVLILTLPAETSREARRAFRDEALEGLRLGVLVLPEGVRYEVVRLPADKRKAAPIGAAGDH